MKNKAWAVCFLMLLLTGLTGCTTIDGKVSGKKEVMEQVREAVPTEHYQYLGRETIAESPKAVEYRFSSKERELPFTACSTLSQVYFDASATSFYSRVVNIDYANRVHELYRDRVLETLRKSSYYVEDGYSSCFKIVSYEDLTEVASALFEADQVYAEELHYNEEEWMKQNPVLSAVYVQWYPSTTDLKLGDNWVSVMNYSVNGTRSYDEIMESLSDAYIRCMKDEKIPQDVSIPENRAKQIHRSSLENIVINGQVMFMQEKASTHSSTKMRCYQANYCEEAGEYLLILNAGMTEEGYEEPLLETYAGAVGGTCRVYYEEGKAEWTIGADRYSMKAYEDKEGYIDKVKFYKNENQMKAGCIYPNSDSFSTGATFLFAVPVTDFCELFQLDYAIDENSNELRLTTRE